MNHKTLIQISLVFLIFVISSFFYKKYFHDETIEITEQKKNDFQKEIEEKNSSGNIVKDIIYKSEDEKGNIYTIKSEYGEFDSENSDIILMTKVSAVIKLSEGSAMLYSDNAKYNIVNNNTNFYNNVILDYLNHKVNADNIDVFFRDSKLEAYNNLVYRNLDLSLIADKIEVDLKKNNSKIYMFNNDKVKILKK